MTVLTQLLFGTSTTCYSHIFFFQAEDGIRDHCVTGVQTCALPIYPHVREAYSKYVGAGFRHHNPFFEGSAESLMAGMEENARQNPNKVFEVKRVIEIGRASCRERV